MIDESDDDLRKLGSNLSRTIGSDNLIDTVTLLGDAGLSVATDTIAGLPIFSGLVSGARALVSLRQELDFKKLCKFLDGVDEASPAKRKQFTDNLQDEGRLGEFGQQILLIMTRLDDLSKPGMVGRVLAAHIDGHIEYRKAMRLAAIIDRSYAEDLDYLKTFTPGVQREGSDIAAMLHAVGLLATGGLDGGTIGDALSGGVIYELNEYGELLLKYAFEKDKR